MALGVLTAILSIVGFAFIPVILMGKAFLVGIAWARYPGHRVTPLDAWAFFDRAARRKMRLSWALSTVIVVGLFALGFYLGSTEGTAFHKGLPTLMTLVESSQVSGAIGGFCLMAFLTCLFWAPRCAKLWTLTLLNILTALLIYALLAVAELVTLPAGLIWATDSVEVNNAVVTYSFSLVPLYNLALLTLACVLAWRGIRRGGEGWFRFEQ